jgi:hypothetical protein
MAELKDMPPVLLNAGLYPDAATLGATGEKGRLVLDYLQENGYHEVFRNGQYVLLRGRNFVLAGEYGGSASGEKW